MTSVRPPLPPELDQALRRELITGERVLWSAQPAATKMKSGFVIWFFAIPWTAFALFWEMMALMPWFASTKTPETFQWTFGIVMPLWGIPFVLIGLWMLSRPIRMMRRAKLTAYALTNRRMLRLVDAKKRELESVMVDQIGPIGRSEGRDGWGHLRIQTHSRVDSDGDRITERFEILSVPDVAGLERLLLETRSAG